MAATSETPHRSPDLPDWVPGFLRAFRRHDRTNVAASKARVDRSSVYKLAKQSSAFTELWHQAREARQLDIAGAAAKAVDPAIQPRISPEST